MIRFGRRFLLGAGVGVVVAIAASGANTAFAAETDEIKFGVLLPLSGAMARSGNLTKAGIEAAVQDINAGGGIKSLDGAKLKPVILDSGSTVESAANAAQRLLAQEPDIVAGIGVWLSSHTLAATEITERAGLPWLTFSYSDMITNRGFGHVVATAPAASRFAAESIEMISNVAKNAVGSPPKTMGIIADGTLTAQTYVNALKDGILKNAGIEIVVDETFTSPLSDATAMVQRLRRAMPDITLVYTGNVADSKLVFSKIKEFGLGTDVPLYAMGTQNAAPEMLENVGAELLEGLFVVVAQWGIEKNRELEQSLIAQTGEPWIIDDTFVSYGSTMLLADAVERAKSTDREAIMQALRSTDTAEGPSKFFPGKSLSFDETGRIENAPLLLVQWRGGKPITVYPEFLAVEDPVWKKN